MELSKFKNRYLLLFIFFGLFLTSSIYASNPPEGIPQEMWQSKIVFVDQGNPVHPDLTVEKFFLSFSQKDNGFLSSTYDLTYRYFDDDVLGVRLFLENEEEPVFSYFFRQKNNNFAKLAAIYDFESEEEVTEPISFFFYWAKFFVDGATRQ